MDQKSMLTALIGRAQPGSGRWSRRFARAPMGAFRLAPTLAIALALCACDRSDSDAARSGECSRFCEALEKCDDATDLLDCRDQCEDDDVRSNRYYRARADCAEELSCSRWAKEVNGQGEDLCTGGCNLIDCVDDALGQLKLTDQEKNVCMDIGTKLNACDRSLEPGVTGAECEAVLPVLSDSYLEESIRCGEKLCDQISSCIETLADRHQTEIKLFSGP